MCHLTLKRECADVIELMAFIKGKNPGLFMWAQEYYERGRQVNVKESNMMTEEMWQGSRKESEIERCYAIGFEDGGGGHESSNVGSL